LLVSFLIAGALLAQTPAQDRAKQDRLQWWRDAHFGMFIHWGLYAVPAGEWKGQQIPGIGEWIMNRAKIPVVEYEQLAKQFNPTKFDAEAFVQVAKAAGQKYMVITAKHHDGFAMWHSKVSKYNVYDATPFHRDVVGELAEACRRNGMRLGFYYSQTQDWHERDATGNNWDFPDKSKKDFDKYLHEKAIPQVRELLTNYGPVALIWFDTPINITPAESQELVDLVHSIQPNCLVDGRIGNDKGDYASMDDNQSPVNVLNYDWETPVTLNDTWGFKKYDNNWKSSETLIRQLADAVSKHGNYLVNVGPTADGIIPEASVERLRGVGDWMRVNGEAIYGATASPYPYEFEWGSVTAKPGRLYLQFSEWPKQGDFTLYGLSNKVSKAYALAARGAHILVSQKTVQGRHELHLKMPAAAPDPNMSVVALEMQGAPDVDRALTQQPDGTVTLSPVFAKVEGPAIRIDSRGVAQNWVNSADILKWDFKLVRPGTYEVVAMTAEVRRALDWSQAEWSGGHDVKVSIGDRSVEGVVERQGEKIDPRNPNFRDVRSVIGKIELSATGAQQLQVRAVKINAEKRLGFRLREIRLVPAGAGK
jgi:alpha-L-fucosidase